MVADAYTIIDMSVWGWARALPRILGEDAWSQFPNIKRLMDEINSRPSVERVNALASKYSFKTEMDEEALGNMFPSNKRLSAA